MIAASSPGKKGAGEKAGGRMIPGCDSAFRVFNARTLREERNCTGHVHGAFDIAVHRRIYGGHLTNERISEILDEGDVSALDANVERRPSCPIRITSL